MLGSVLNDLDSFSIFQLPVSIRRELLTSAVDGQHVNLDWYDSTEDVRKGTTAESSAEFSSAHQAETRAANNRDEKAEADRSPIIVLIHGIAGNSNEGYMCRLAHSFVRLGWRACSFDYWRFDFGCWRDMDVIVKHLQKKYPRAPIAAVGVSAGGHVLLRYLQATSTDCPLVAAVAISPCQDLIKETQRVRAEENPGYMLFLRYCVMKCAVRHIAEGKWSDSDVRAYVGVHLQTPPVSVVVHARCVTADMKPFSEMPRPMSLLKTSTTDSCLYTRTTVVRTHLSLGKCVNKQQRLDATD